MININALDNIIAVVVVILLLSLIVQSIQSALKKAFKIKSRQIEDSLVDLFENVVNYDPKSEPSPTSIPGKLRGWLERICGSSPILRRVFQFITRTPHPNDPSAHPDESVKILFNEVIKGFEEIGRVAQTGKRMLDSISKEDLKKVMGKVLPDTLLKGFTSKLATACGAVVAVENAVKTINDNYLGILSGDANAKFAAMQQALAPLLNDLRSVFDGAQLTPGLVIGDIQHLREINLSDVLGTLGEIQKKVAADLAAAQEPQASALKKLAEALGEISASLTKLSAGLDAAVAPLRTKLNEVETWYDTVTQSFEERYTRGMKTWAMVISFLVVAYLNASVFEIYKSVVTNEALRNQLVQTGEERTKANEQRLARAKEDNNQQQESVTLQQIQKDRDDIRKQVESLSSFGLRPLTWQGVKERFNPKLWFSEGWLNRRKEDFKTLAGWIVMMFLLSIGAPFWEDTLESLFGVKNLLRKKSSTKNVETESGAGQPKP